MTEDLATWLLEQIAEDERRAHATTLAATWCVGDDSSEYFVSHVVYPLQGDELADVRAREALGIVAQHAETAEHIARWDPARVLAECDAKRQVLNEHGIIYRDIGFLEEDEGEMVDATEELPVCGRCVPKHSSFNRREQIPIGPCRTVRLLAMPYADRPGYREEWRP